jgi:hypothetical protein
MKKCSVRTHNCTVCKGCAFVINLVVYIVKNGFWSVKWAQEHNADRHMRCNTTAPYTVCPRSTLWKSAQTTHPISLWQKPSLLCQCFAMFRPLTLEWHVLSYVTTIEHKILLINTWAGCAYLCDTVHFWRNLFHETAICCTPHSSLKWDSHITRQLGCKHKIFRPQTNVCPYVFVTRQAMCLEP